MPLVAGGETVASAPSGRGRGYARLRASMSDEAPRHHLRTPTSQLPHAEKVRREQRHVQILTGVLLAVLAMLAYASAFDLDHWAEWVVLGGIVLAAIGAIVAVYRP